jgi:hypothetical protein
LRFRWDTHYVLGTTHGARPMYGWEYVLKPLMEPPISSLVFFK